MNIGNYFIWRSNGWHNLPARNELFHIECLICRCLFVGFGLIIFRRYRSTLDE